MNKKRGHSTLLKKQNVPFFEVLWQFEVLGNRGSRKERLNVSARPG